MDVTINRDALVRELALARRLGERKSTIAVYSYAKFGVEFGEVTIAATDGDSSLQTGCAATVAEPGQALVPIRTLHEIARASAHDAIRLAVKGGRVHVEAGKFKSTLQTMPADDFPQLPEWPAETIDLPAFPLRAALQKTKFVVDAAASRSGQYYMQGILFVLAKDGLTIVATDGFRLGKVDIRCQSTVPSRVILPRKTMDDLAALLSADDAPASVGYADVDGKVFFAVGVRRFASRTVDAQFPNFERVIPKGGKFTAEMDRDLLHGALRRVLLVANDRNKRARVAFADGQLTASIENVEVGDAVESVPAQLANGGWETAFDVSYLVDFLGVADPGTITVAQNEHPAPALFRSAADASDYSYALMPMA